MLPKMDEIFKKINKMLLFLNAAILHVMYNKNPYKSFGGSCLLDYELLEGEWTVFIHFYNRYPQPRFLKVVRLNTCLRDE